ncbi:MAG: NAD(P)H-dependent oxidoreductase [Pseudomonadota bacterium]
MRVFIWVGHPGQDSLSSVLADTFTEGLSEQTEVRRLDLASMQFDPNLSDGYNTIQPLEPDLVRWQRNMKWCQHMVWFYPDWWGGMPAKMKGVVDRALLPGFGFKYRQSTPLWRKLLRGRTADIVVTAGAPAWYDRLANGAPGRRQVARSILQFTGVETLRMLHFAPARTVSPRRLRAWKRKVSKLAQSIG